MHFEAPMTPGHAVCSPLYMVLLIIYDRDLDCYAAKDEGQMGLVAPGWRTASSGTSEHRNATSHPSEVTGGHEPDYRFTLANERTFLAWQRTALGLLAAAVALVQLVPRLAMPGSRSVFGVGLALLAMSTSTMGLLRWRQADQAMRRGGRLPRHPSPAYLAVGLSLVAAIAISLVIGQVLSS